MFDFGPEKLPGLSRNGPQASMLELLEYRKITKISPGNYIFLKVLFGGLIFGGAYLPREICVSKSIGLAL